MDTTEKYIKMCEAADEIQSIRSTKGFFQEGDFTADFHNNKYRPGVPNIDPYVGTLIPVAERDIWLPRMDQLWEMISDDAIKNLWDFYHYMSVGYQHDDPYQMDNVKSIEVGLLMFVMRENHNKKWDGTKWVGGF